MSKPTDEEEGAYIGSVIFDVYENSFDISKTDSLTFQDIYVILYASLVYLQDVAKDMETVKKISKTKLH
jgi:hypothetical protein